jgi:hypothetical protein
MKKWVLISVLACSLVSQTVSAETAIYGDPFSNTFVYGDILRRQWDKCGLVYGYRCDNLGPGVCEYDVSGSSPYRGSYVKRFVGYWVGDVRHDLYGDDPNYSNYLGADYIYPADNFESSVIACGTNYWIAIDGNRAAELGGCDCGSVTADFQSPVRIYGDYGSSNGLGDHIWGWDEYDILYGEGGDDYIHGGGSFDDIYGEEGNDYLYADTTSVDYEYLSGGGGNDHIYGADDADFYDLVDGGAGDDVIYGYAGDDVLNGDAGNDTLRGGSGTDVLDGGDNTDCLDDLTTSTCDCGGGSTQDKEHCTSSTDCDFHVSNCAGT